MYPITYIPCAFPSASFFLDIYVEFPPASICFASDTELPDVFLTYVGVDIFVEFPSPSCEFESFPTEYTYPFSASIIEWFVPAAISFIPLTNVIFCGNTCMSVFPIPNWPELLYPVDHTFPSASSIIVWFAPAATCIIFDTFFIFTGYNSLTSLLLLPIPSSPSSFLPQPYTSPSAVTA